MSGTRQAHAAAAEADEEDRQRGSVSLAVWLKYLHAIGEWLFTFLVFAFAINTLVTYSGTWWISQWSALKYGDDVWFYVAVYIALSASASVLVLGRVLTTYIASLKASKFLFKAGVDGVLGTTMAFFDVTPTGRLLNRFSKDMQVIDMQLAPTFGQVMVMFFRILCSLYFIVAGSSLWVLAAFPPIGVLYAAASRYFRASTRELQRLESVSKSPIYAAFTEALNGASTIQAMDAIGRFERSQDQRFDTNLKPMFLLQASSAWFAMRLELFSNIIAGFAAVMCVVSTDDDTDPRTRAANAGLALTYAPLLTELMNNFLKQLTFLETQMVSVERLHAYTELVAEEPGNKPLPSVQWPSAGAIEFKDVVMGYRLGLPDVLNGPSFSILGGEKCGVCGRTASGKSTLLVCLFRLVELRGGSIYIDGVDISSIPLASLRSKLAIIPQDPVLFTGSLRYNLDPSDEHTDEEIMATLRACSMAGPVESHAEGLLRPLEEGGSNLSAGQRQLACMARALLRRARVLVLDEATASIDMETDDVIQQTLRERLGGVTVVTIAHRLNTILDYDKVLVMDKGKLAEMGSPAELKERPDGKFRALLERQADKGGLADGGED